MDGFFHSAWAQVKALRPSFVSKKPHFNFISAHYFIIIGFTLLGSVILYGSGQGQLAYIDALTFAAGANTQAGLNTVDVNKLSTFQQVVIYVLAATCNPITINSCVVFLRLYWFEKRFQHVVKEARTRRGTLSKSKSKAKPDDSEVERGVNGRDISVMRDGERQRITNDGILLDARWNKAESVHGSSPDGEPDPRAVMSDPQLPEARRTPGIKFADTVKRSDGVQTGLHTTLPLARSDNDHIAILERQRNVDDEVLRIPGPRDAERGLRPERVTQERNGDADFRHGHGRSRSMDSDAPPMADRRQQAITIQEPDRTPLEQKESTAGEEFADDVRALGGIFAPLRLRKPRIFNKEDQTHHREENELHVTHSRRSRTFENLRSVMSRDKGETDLAPYLSWQPTLGRNSAFPGLTEEQREELGGIEYRSLKTLALILTCYFWGFTILGIIVFVPWILKTDVYGQIVDSAEQSRVWWGFFTPHSAFMDLGFTLTPDSMNSFNTAVMPMLVMSFLIIIGNTGFPVMLRFLIWLSSLLIPHGTGLYEELRFLLDHPRRCFTLLFPSGATWWLFWLLVVLNGVDLIFFIVLDLGNGPVVDLPGGIRVLDGLFQAASTRTAGFSCINLAALHPGVQVSYLIMMYISVFPIAISVRRTNVYEEKALGIYANAEEQEEAGANNNDLSYVGAHLRRQLSFDLWYIFVGLFILAISEGPRLMSGDIQLFAVLFEVVSAYGTVGMSLGYSAVNASLCSQFSVVGKLVIVAMMIRGRHRGLPYGLDRAILLPSDTLNAKEAADADMRGPKRPSTPADASPYGHSTGVNNAGGPGPRMTAQRTRRRSSLADRTSFIAQFLQPGPPVSHETLHLHPSSALHPPRRSVTDPGTADDDDAMSPELPRLSAYRAQSHNVGHNQQNGAVQ